MSTYHGPSGRTQPMNMRRTVGEMLNHGLHVWVCCPACSASRTLDARALLEKGAKEFQQVQALPLRCARCGQEVQKTVLAS